MLQNLKKKEKEEKMLQNLKKKKKKKKKDVESQMRIRLVRLKKTGLRD